MITTANTIEKVTDIDLNGKSIECAKLTITDTSVPFVLKNIMTSGKDYTFSLYLKNTNSSSITIMGEELTSSATWVRQYTSFAATGTDLSILFKVTGTYYFYNMQLETGKICSDWTPNPADVDDDLENTTSIAQQAADKFSWIVKSGTSASNFEITDRMMNLVSEHINLDGVVSFVNTASGNGKRNLYNLPYADFENIASKESEICYTKDKGVSTVAIDKTTAYNGNKSLKISYAKANLNSNVTPVYLGSSKNNYGCVPFEAGKKYILSCYIKADTNAGLFVLDVQGHDTPDTSTGGLYLSKFDPTKLPGSSKWVGLSTSWQRAICAIEVSTTSSNGYWSIVPLIWGTSSSLPDTFNVWVDCIMLEEVDSLSNQPSVFITDQETVIDGGTIKTHTVTADCLAANAIMSQNYELDDNGNVVLGSFLNLADGSFSSKYLNWDENGTLTAANVNISGKIKATSGTIAGWTITDGKMYTNGSGKYSGIGKNGSAYAFWAGATAEDNGVTGAYRVKHDGTLEATKAIISGSVTATDGKIADWNIAESGLYTNESNKFDIKTHNAKKLYNSSDIESNVHFGESSLSTYHRIMEEQKVGDASNYKTYHVCTINGTAITSDGIDVFISEYIGSDDPEYGTYSLSLRGNRLTFREYDNDGNQTLIDKDRTLLQPTSLFSPTITTNYLKSTGIVIANTGNITGNLYAKQILNSGHYTWENNESNYITCSTYNNTVNNYYYANGYHAFYINDAETSLSEKQYGMLWIDQNGLSMNGEFGLYSNTMDNYVARYYVAGSTKCTAIGNNSYATRIYGSSVWANKSITTSDERLKRDFNSLDKYDDIYMMLKPVSFKYLEGFDEGNNTYFGLKAQSTEKLFESIGENPEDYAIFSQFGIDHEDMKNRLGHDVEFDTEHGLSYTNLIAWNLHMIQKTRRELEQLRTENNQLKATLEAIQAKLDM